MVSPGLFDNLVRSRDRTAIITEDSQAISYGRLTADGDSIAKHFKRRCLAFTLCSNAYESIAGYVGMARAGVVQALFNSSLDPALLGPLLEAYKPAFVFLPSGGERSVAGDVVERLGQYVLVKTKHEPHYDLHSDLALLLPTSGSTGSPKFVRLSSKNLAANAASIASSLGIEPSDRPITTLPMNYSYGLSILNSHLASGASILLSKASLATKDFWKTLDTNKATTFGGVPFTFEVLKKLRFEAMVLPSLRYLTQAGGKMRPELTSELIQVCEKKGMRFISMYGQTEATARMSYLPWKNARDKVGSIGKCIPGGRFWLEDENGKEILENCRSGELVYLGDNVSLGYAEGFSDLRRGDENRGILRTGDIAERDEDGFYYVVGRKSRFLKVFGNRVNLLEIESLVGALGFECACGGQDDDLTVYVTGGDPNEILAYLQRLTGLPLAGLSVVPLARIPRNDAGKVLYSELKKSA